MNMEPTPITGTIHYDPDVDWSTISGPQERASMVFYDDVNEPFCFAKGVTFTNAKIEQVPDGPWQRFKERWIPKWLRRLIPCLRVRYIWGFSMDCVAESVETLETPSLDKGRDWPLDFELVQVHETWRHGHKYAEVVIRAKKPNRKAYAGNLPLLENPRNVY